MQRSPRRYRQPSSDMPPYSQITLCPVVLLYELLSYKIIFIGPPRLVLACRELHRNPTIQGRRHLWTREVAGGDRRVRFPEVVHR